MSFTHVSLNAVGSDQIGTTGDIFAFDVPKSKITMHAFGGGGNMVVWLQLSLDGVNFADVAEITASTGPMATSDDHIAIAARARLQNMTPGNTLTAIIGIEPSETGLAISQS